MKVYAMTIALSPGMGQEGADALLGVYTQMKRAQQHAQEIAVDRIQQWHDTVGLEGYSQVQVETTEGTDLMGRPFFTHTARHSAQADIWLCIRITETPFWR